MLKSNPLSRILKSSNEVNSKNGLPTVGNNMKMEINLSYSKSAILKVCSALL